MSRNFVIHIEADFNLLTEHIWPDGNAPANPTADDVANLMRSLGAKARVLHDWCLDDVEVSVSDDAHHSVVVWR